MTITAVERCPDRTHVVVTLSTDAEIVCVDDGSFIEWLGESESE